MGSGVTTAHISSLMSSSSGHIWAFGANKGTALNKTMDKFNVKSILFTIIGTVIAAINLIHIIYLSHHSISVLSNRPYLESAFFQMCMILTLVLVSFERK